MLEQEKIYKKPVFGLKMGLKGLTLRLFGLKGLILRPQKQGWLKRLDFKPPQLSDLMVPLKNSLNPNKCLKMVFFHLKLPNLHSEKQGLLSPVSRKDVDRGKS